MSSVTNIILKVACSDKNQIYNVNKYFKDRPGFYDEDIGNNCGGEKAFEKIIYIAAFDKLNLYKFLIHLKAIPWDFPEEVQLFVCEQGDDNFSEVFQSG